MQISLLGSYPDESVAWKAAATCVGKFHEATEKNMLAALSRGHLSVIEHLPMSFAIEGVPRSLTHQLVRHRIASYSELSQRYTVVDTENFVMPTVLVNDEEVIELLKKVEETYKNLLSKGIKKEDARAILPECSPTTIIYSTNARAFIEVCNKRLCVKAQQNIREAFYKMKNLIKNVYPNVYELCLPNCANCKEKNPCIKSFKEE